MQMFNIENITTKSEKASRVANLYVWGLCLMERKQIHQQIYGNHMPFDCGTNYNDDNYYHQKYKLVVDQIIFIMLMAFMIN